MKRFDLTAIMYDHDMRESKDGDYILYEDHVKAIKDLQAVQAKLAEYVQQQHPAGLGYVKTEPEQIIAQARRECGLEKEY